MTLDLSKRATVREMVQAHEQAELAIEGAWKSMSFALAQLNESFSTDPTGHNRFRVIPDRYAGRSLDLTSCDDQIEALRRQSWDCLVDRLELRRMMSPSAWDELAKKLNEEAPQPITEDAVLNFARRYSEQLPAMIQQSVAEVRDWLVPRSADSYRAGYKTNNLLAVGKRVVLTNIVEPHFLGEGFSVNHHDEQWLIALENLFSGLAGYGNIGKEHFSQLSRAIKESGKAGSGETEFFRFRCFRNRNLHLEFRRKDLLAKFNQIAGGKRLAPETRAA